MKNILAQAFFATLVALTSCGILAQEGDSNKWRGLHSLQSMGTHNPLLRKRLDNTMVTNSGSAILTWQDSERVAGACNPLGCGASEGRRSLDATGLCFANYMDGRVVKVPDENCESVAENIGSRITYEYCEVEYTPCEQAASPPEPGPEPEPTYTCPPEYTLSGTMCLRTIGGLQESIASSEWTCPRGGDLVERRFGSGYECKLGSWAPYAASWTTTHTCPEGTSPLDWQEGTPVTGTQTGTRMCSGPRRTLEIPATVIW